MTAVRQLLDDNYRSADRIVEYLHRIGYRQNLTAVYPELSRVWIRTGDRKLPLKAVWIDESKLNQMLNELGSPQTIGETTELAEDHLVLVAV